MAVILENNCMVLVVVLVFMIMMTMMMMMMWCWLWWRHTLLVVVVVMMVEVIYTKQTLGWRTEYNVVQMKKRARNLRKSCSDDRQPCSEEWGCLNMGNTLCVCTFVNTFTTLSFTSFRNPSTQLMLVFWTKVYMTISPVTHYSPFSTRVFWATIFFILHKGKLMCSSPSVSSMYRWHRVQTFFSTQEGMLLKRR